MGKLFRFSTWQWFGSGLALVGLILGLAIAPLRLAASPHPSASMELAQAQGSVEDLQQQQQQLEQERSNVLEERDRLENLQESAQNRLDSLQRNIRSTEDEIAYQEEQLNRATQHLQQLQESLAIAEAHYQERQFSTVARLRYLQRQQGASGWAVLLHSDNLNDFLDRRQQLRRVYQSDRDILDSLKTEADDLNRRRLDVELQRNQIALIRQQLLAQKSEYEAQADAQKDLLDRLQQDRAALEAAEEQLARDSMNLTVIIQQLVSPATSDRPIIRGTGRFSYPSNGFITSGYGWRIHPILGYERFHAGVDFGADYGAAIRAADAGVVIFSGWYGGYGLAVIIDHGDGLTTLYGHSDDLYVAEGEIVQQGQAIAAIGSTGLSTGPHLHFEVRENGEPVDPMAFL